MNYKEKVLREKQLMKHWEDIKCNQESLYDLFLHKRKFEPMDIAVVFQCIILVLEKLEIHGDEVEKMVGKDIIGEMECFFITLDDKSSMAEKFQAIEKIKKTAWKIMYKRKEAINNLTKVYPVLGVDEVILIFKCISMILLELDMQDQEKRLLEDLYNIPGE